MGLIKKLPLHEAQKIAAGEVVERPANVVKELLENALDAHATTITLYLENAGKNLIRVVDNGCGMNEEDAHLCIEHHATSKITTVDDLQTVETFGFRGEALSSIASVSHVTLTTRTHDTPHGIKLHIENGTITHKESVSTNIGTDIAIRDLFYNVPVRKKFLKTRDTEWRHILNLFQAFCLDYTHINFSLFSEGHQFLNCPSADTIQTRIAQLWDHTVAQNMLTLNTEHNDDQYTITGLISHHQYVKYDRSSLFFFVNKRWIKNQHLSRALLKGYMNVLPPARYPAAFIFITLDPTHVDINIHPRKEEVTFLHPRIIESRLYEAVKKTHDISISQNIKKSFLQAPEKQISKESYKPDPLPQYIPKKTDYISSDVASCNPNPKLSFDDFNKKLSLKNIPEKEIELPHTTHVQQKPCIPASQQQSQEKEQIAFTYEHQKCIGQHKKTYILIEQHDGILFIDQHAAHERILYELFSQRFHEVATIKLIFPIMIPVSAQDITLLKPHLHLVRRNGIEIEIFGTDQLIVQSVPAYLKNVALDDLIRQVIGWITEYHHLDEEKFTKTIHEKLHAQMACKAAIKAGDTLTDEQIKQLLEDLYKTTNRFTCPHGRPTSWFLNNHEIEKKFKRDYRSSPQSNE